MYIASANWKFYEVCYTRIFRFSFVNESYTRYETRQNRIHHSYRNWWMLHFSWSENPELSTWHYSKNSKDLVCIISWAYGSWKHIWFEFCIIGKALCPLLFALFWRVLELDGCQYSCRYYYLLSWLKCNQSLDPPISLNHNRGYSLH